MLIIHIIFNNMECNKKNQNINKCKKVLFRTKLK